ncbi:MAG: Si-specific NAD(P)(+) transhydrogenase [Planctomycetes bacterium]|nr:Si-specific NAD(P)(+) transhydrogenase [Planctomycetota bacterium]
MPTHQYDLVVIGSGPAGEKGAAQAAYFGKRVALVEREPVLGGAAANTGTLPSKTLRETALMLSGFRARGLYGVDLSLRRQATVRDFLFREEQVKEIERERVLANIGRHRVDVFHGLGSFVDPCTVKVEPGKNAAGAEPVLLRGQAILIATGSSPRRLNVFPFDDPRVYDSDTVLGLHELPRTMAVIGAGVIGCEYACMFAALGVRVSLVNPKEAILEFLDHEVAAALKQRIIDLGVTFVAPGRVEACVPEADHLLLKLDPARRVKADAVLVTAGRVGNTAALNLPAAGLVAGKNDLLEVDAAFRTKAPHIFAAGDVIGFPALASTSMEQARLAMVNAFDLKYKTEVAPILPYGIYTIPEVSMAGETEETLREKRTPYVVGKASYGLNARGVIIGDYTGFLKLLFALDTMRLVGVHVIGESASELVHVGLLALMMGATQELFIRTCFNYPTLGELYKYATYDAMGRRAKMEAGK